MDNKQFITALSRKCSLDYKDVSGIIPLLVDALVDAVNNGNSVAAPGFGTFTPVKHEEQIIDDKASGNKILMPPAITLKFTPSQILTKRVSL